MSEASKLARRQWMQRGAALLAAAALADSATAMPASPPGALLLGQRGGPNEGVDERIARRLTQLGFAVTRADQDAAPQAAQGMALVVISSTVAAKHVNAGWRYAPVPLLTWENDCLDDLAMTGKRSGADYGEAPRERYLWLVNAPHPLAAGLPAGVTNVYVKQAGMSWGRPGLGASTIATLYGQPEKAAIFGYEKGATMDYESLAPARRVMFFLDNESFDNLSPAGLQLFDAAVAWAAQGK